MRLEADGLDHLPPCKGQVRGIVEEDEAFDLGPSGLERVRYGGEPLADAGHGTLPGEFLHGRNVRKTPLIRPDEAVPPPFVPLRAPAHEFAGHADGVHLEGRMVETREVVGVRQAAPVASDLCRGVVEDRGQSEIRLEGLEQAARSEANVAEDRGGWRGVEVVRVQAEADDHMVVPLQKSAMLRAVSRLISGHVVGIISVPWMVPMTCRHWALTPSAMSSR